MHTQNIVDNDGIIIYIHHFSFLYLPYSTMTTTFEDIQLSFNDKRTYRYITLPNELSAILINDPDTEKSAACCDVRVE